MENPSIRVYTPLKSLFPLLIICSSINKFLVTTAVDPEISEMNIGGLVKLLDSWDIPKHFEVIIFTRTKFQQEWMRFQTMERGLVHISGNGHYQCTDIWSRQNPFLVLIHIPSNLTQLEKTFNEISLCYHLNLWSPKASGTLYHVIFWPISSSTDYESDRICDSLPSNLPLIPLHSNLYVLSPLRNTIIEIYHIKTQLHCQSTSVPDGEISGEPKFQEILRRVARRKNFSGVNIVSTAAVEKSTEFEVYYEEVNGTVISARGLAVEIFKDLEFLLKFSGVYMRGDWIVKDNKGRPWGLTVDQLLNRTADIYITQTSLSPYRAIGLSYIQPTFQDSIYAFVRQPPSASVHDVHISPFQNDLWVAIFASWVVLAIALYYIAYAHHSFCTPRPIPQWSNYNHLHEAFLWSISAGCNQGWYSFPKSTCCRIVVLLGSASGLIVSAMYSGSIISSLTSDSPPIQSFGDLLTSSIDIYADNTSSTVQRVLQHIRHVNPASQRFQNAEDGVSMRAVMRRPGAAVGFARNFYRTANSLNYTSNQVCDGFSKFPILRLPIHNGMMVPRWSPFRETFNYNIIKLKERGLIGRYFNSFQLESSPPCAQKVVVYSENLGIQDVFTAFGFLLGGISIALFIFMFERWKKWMDGVLPNDKTECSQGST